MRWFKELWWLIKQLFKDNPSDRNSVTYKLMKYFPFSGYSAMSWCGYLVTKKDELYFDNQKGKITKNHETIHLKQAQVKGSWIKYYWSYLCEWLKGNPIIYPGSSAYYTIPYEMEAYANQDDFVYCESYDKSNLSKYKIKDRKKTYLKHKCNGWIKYLKTL